MRDLTLASSTSSGSNVGVVFAAALAAGLLLALVAFPLLVRVLEVIPVEVLEGLIRPPLASLIAG